MGIYFKLLLLLPLAVCTGFPCHESPPLYITRLGSMMPDIQRFTMYRYSLNYDAYFFTPAFMTLSDGELIKKDGFLDFFVEDFSLKEHARDFKFSENETKQEFAKRFFRYIADAENVPPRTRELAAKYAIHYQPGLVLNFARGFIRPCPLYSFVRALTFFEEKDKFAQMGFNNVEVVMKFLLTEFEPKDYHIEDKADVADILKYLAHSSSSEPLILTDGSVASKRNKELLQRLMVEKAVPQHVKDAIKVILPHM